jgi:hypothetical protein
LKIWRLIAGVLLAVSTCAPALSQQTKAQLNAQNNAVIVTNGVGAITAANLHPIIQNMINAACTIADPINCPITALTGATTPGAPLIGAPSGGGVLQGTRAGNTTVYPTLDAAGVDGQCPQFDSFGGFLSIACPTGGAGGIPNASGSNQSTTANCVSGNTTLTLTAAIDFAIGQGISLEHCGAAFTGSPPTSVSVAVTGGMHQGPAGSTTYAYQVACVDNSGGVGAATSPATTTIGFSSLAVVTLASRVVSYNRVLWTAGAGCSGYAVWGSKSGGAFHLLSVINRSNEFDDYGVAATSPPWVPALPPSAALADRLVSSISSVVASPPSVVLAAPTTTAVTGAFARHDDTAALNTFLASNPQAILVPGTYNIESITVPSTVSAFTGAGMGSSIIQGWGSTSSILSLTSMPSGFTLSGMSIKGVSAGGQTGVVLSNTTNGVITNVSISGVFIGFDLETDATTSISGSSVNDYDFLAFFDHLGINNTISNNTASLSVEPWITETYQAQKSFGTTFQNNLDLSHDLFSFLSEDSNNVIMIGNKSFNSYGTQYQISGTGQDDVIMSNYASSFGTNVELCIDISDDEEAGAILQDNVISGNYVLGCGVAGLSVFSFEASGTVITNTTISGNTIVASNTNAQPNQPDILVEGGGITNTFIQGNTFMSGSAVQFNIQEVTFGGTPVETFVGPNLGLPGSSGVTSLIGAGSVVFSGGSTGISNSVP